MVRREYQPNNCSKTINEAVEIMEFQKLINLWNIPFNFSIASPHGQSPGAKNFP